MIFCVGATPRKRKIVVTHTLLNFKSLEIENLGTSMFVWGKMHDFVGAR